jgi:hypothetical protein
MVRSTAPFSPSGRVVVDRSVVKAALGPGDRSKGLDGNRWRAVCGELCEQGEREDQAAVLQPPSMSARFELAFVFRILATSGLVIVALEIIAVRRKERAKPPQGFIAGRE